jgi:hypothetical protein
MRLNILRHYLNFNMKPIENFRLYALTSTKPGIRTLLQNYCTWTYLFNLIDPVSLNIRQITSEKF